MKSELLSEADSQIAETNRYLMQFGEAVPDPRAIEMVKETGQYAKKNGVPVSYYVDSKYDANQLTKLFVKGASEEDLTNFYENPIKEKMDLDVGDYNLLGTGESNNYNINLKKFFELPTEEKVNYFNRLKNFGKKVISVALAASLLTAPIVAVSDSGSDIPEDWYDNTLNIISPSALRGGYVMYFEEISKSLNEPIKIPDATTQNIMENYKKGTPIKISSADIAPWTAVMSEKTPAVCPYVALVDTDGNEKPDTLYAMYLGQREDGKLTSTAGVPREFYDLEGNKIDFKGNPDYLINPFDTLGSDESNIANLLYFKDPSMINFGDKPTAIHWKDAIGKTPKELGLDEYNKPTAADRKAYEARQDEKLYEQLVEQGIGEESAEKMVKDMKTDTATGKDKTNPLVYLVPAGFGAAGVIYLATKKKSGPLPTPVTPA